MPRWTSSKRLANPSPEHLFEQAEYLVFPMVEGRPRQVNVRRAISTAYYGAFHAVVAAAADQFVGKTKRSTNLYGLVYRSVDHRRLRDICDDLRKPSVPQKYHPYVPKNGFGRNVVAFATAVVELQEKRHAADYDPIIRVRTSDATTAIRTARAALAAFERASATRRRAFLTLLLFPPRR